MLDVSTKDGVVYVTAKGKVTDDDYEDVLVPAVDSQIKEHGEVSLFYHYGPEAEGFTPGAMWEDTKLGLKHIGDFKRIAFVSDVGFFRAMIGIFGALIPAPVKVYANADIEEAKAWIVES